ncbi:hypothetical protein C0J56_28340 [Pseudomonas fluorescens]|nr:hypothetical protein C0J56_28340 [Pseudomonas fluorescens]
MWEQGLPAIAAPRYQLQPRVACIASKLCSHRSPLPHLFSGVCRVSADLPRHQSTPAPPTTPAPGCSC